MTFDNFHNNSQPKPNEPKNIKNTKRPKINKKNDDTNINYADIYHKFLFDREDTRMHMKKWFFGTILIVYAFLILFSCALFISAYFVSKETALLAVITAIINLISTNIALPLIIAKNLFQATENDNLQLFFDNYVKVAQLSQQLEAKTSFYTNEVNEQVASIDPKKTAQVSRASNIFKQIEDKQQKESN